VLAEAVEAQRPGVVDEQTEDAAPAGQGADPAVRRVVDAGCDEALEPLAAIVEDADGGVARARDLARDAEQLLQHRLDVAAGDQEPSPRVDQAAQAKLVEHRSRHLSSVNRRGAAFWILRVMDEWGAGSYEDTAAELAPAAAVAVAALGLGGGERVLDVACGTGNAALVAQETGAQVTGLDGSPRLLDVARERVPGADFVHGDMGSLPFGDGQFDAAVSVFGVIFSRPAEPAVAELARVVRPGGRVAITTWPPRGPVFAAVSLMREAVARVRPAPAGPPPANWGDPSGLEGLLGGYGELEVAERQLTHRDATPEEVWDRWERLHPAWVGARAQLEPAGEWPRLREATIAALHDSGFGAGATSPYLLAVLQIPPGG
jgi:SAM-dependent methyltransferase